MESIWQDLGLGIRWLVKSPGFTAVAVLTLALGIGANTAMFTLISAVLLRALPAQDAHRLVILSNPQSHGIGVGDGAGPRYLYAYHEFEELRDQNQAFSGMCDVDSHVRRLDVAIEGSAQNEQANVSLASGNYFKVLDIPPFLGRTFTAEVDKLPL